MSYQPVPSASQMRQFFNFETKNDQPAFYLSYQWQPVETWTFFLSIGEGILDRLKTCAIFAQSVCAKKRNEWIRHKSIVTLESSHKASSFPQTLPKGLPFEESYSRACALSAKSFIINYVLESCHLAKERNFDNELVMSLREDTFCTNFSAPARSFPI